MKETGCSQKEITTLLFFLHRYIIFCYLDNISIYKNTVFGLTSFVCRKNIELFPEREVKGLIVMEKLHLKIDANHLCESNCFRIMKSCFGYTGNLP
ncbi:hypothetical protein A2643_02280 [Candidatus Nomurabacteria bacterium RIFCSPHIGHO2_01_FULL_39_220]|uniref:Uncharacterized protein n=1 Tax=Candidatus Nomurabacteria bacterium RIFCSPLOWO2_02_FULL_40_67 TaxID=1801787 RepID=A0A1F6Y2K6_9BACT|nr:MAG: hypothetical protein A2W12_01280 [Candidatus Nomurabacteria bacterium RBG_16_40_11]OGI70986.1 MAG: hypothetical protein A2643_02280 [Candidatus Nomurabacteria bacterium RIFCSPHIGHO2_01_FULL_39_220]OGI72711.1 MAG: hypothetical protein A2W56_02670 [Candidatus Nomurabacteria bacterium RIFCSPHIGHO2_02_41_18]OGI81023.1 MAG: hypothetical protein A3E03_02095 [Candidatus Nomurabacteria bacterium RIFCSPHIGHO2_12_FULL_40_64]OGI92216.1 MAG: hypothetical protein A3A06_03810 [Candidatus Nomurabacter